MKRNIKATLLVLALSLGLLATACADEPTPYEQYDKDNYTVSVRFDANGGYFDTGVSTITDSYNISDIAKNSSGMAEIPLLSPDDEARGTRAPENKGYFLAGWYTERIGNETEGYTYKNRWDFSENTLQVDPQKSYSASEPILTLYAAWAPEFEVVIYDLETKVELGKFTINPFDSSDIVFPKWNESTAELDLYDFPEKKGYTLKCLYLDEEGSEAVTVESMAHPATLNLEDGTVQNNLVKLYAEWDEGEWYHIYTAEQFVKYADFDVNYVICADLDFTNVEWPSKLISSSFNGKIIGNGHTISNVSLTQTDANAANFGLFAKLGELAVIKDITFDSPTVTIKGGLRKAGSQYGLFTGNLSEKATIEGVSILNGCLEIDSGAHFGTEEYDLSLVCGNIETDKIVTEGLTCVSVGESPEAIEITVDGNTVRVTKISE